MSTPALGDFVRIADQHFEQAATAHGPADAAGAVRYLRRITLDLTRYLKVIGPATGILDGAGGHYLALTSAATHMEEAAEVLGIPSPGTRTARLQALSRTADAVSAGADLLWTHMVTDSAGRLAGRSDWGLVLRTRTVADALADKVTCWSGQVAALCGPIVSSPRLTGSRACTALLSAQQGLAAMTTAPSQARPDGNDPVSGREILYAIPVATPAARPRLAAGQSVEQLCDGIAATADRLKVAAFTMHGRAHWSPGVSGPSWRRAALLADAMLDVAHLAATTPAAHADGPSLRPAAAALRDAHAAWAQAGKVWDVLVTDTLSPMSAITMEAQDLTLQLTRLILQDPSWRPGRTARVPADAAGEVDGTASPVQFTQVLSALHRALDAIARMAAADLSVLREFGHAQRFYMPNRVLDDEYAGSRKYVPAPTARVLLLIDAYRVAAQQTSRAADVLGDLVLRHDAPSKILAMIRKTIPASKTDAQIVDPDDVARRLRHLNRPKRYRGIQRDQVDSAAVVRAYLVDGLTEAQCADKFTTSTWNINVILADNHVVKRPGGYRRRVKSVLLEPQEAASADLPPARSAPPGTTGQAIRADGINDNCLMAGAAPAAEASQPTAAWLAAIGFPQGTQTPRPSSHLSPTVHPRKSPAPGAASAQEKPQPRR